MQKFGYTEVIMNQRTKFCLAPKLTKVDSSHLGISRVNTPAGGESQSRFP